MELVSMNCIADQLAGIAGIPAFIVYRLRLAG
jgi:hypothetical protein